jgi:hypothetical protein
VVTGAVGLAGTALCAGAAIMVPALVYLYVLFQRTPSVADRQEGGHPPG